MSITAVTFAFSKMRSTCDKNLANKTLSDIMNAAISQKLAPIFMDVTYHVFDPNFECFAKENTFTTRLRKSQYSRNI